MKKKAPVVTRTFGLRSSSERGPGGGDDFTKFQRAVNLMIEHGLKFDDGSFKNDGLTSVKRFYDRSRKISSIKEEFKKLGLKERLYRCAAQPAYFAVRNHKTRTAMIRTVIEKVLLPSGPERLFEPLSPSKELVLQAQNAIREEKLGTYSFIYIENTLRYARNLLKKAMVSLHQNELEASIRNACRNKRLIDRVGARITKSITNHLKSFFRALSGNLTRRVKGLGKKKSPPLGKRKQDGLVRRILGTECEDSDREERLVAWKKKRKEWRATRYGALHEEIGSLDTRKLVQLAMKKVTGWMDARHALNIMVKPRKYRNRPRDDSMEEFERYLTSKMLPLLERGVMLRVEADLLQYIENGMKELKENTHKYKQPPRFRGTTIPFGIDDGQVYQLEIGIGRGEGSTVQAKVILSFYNRISATYCLSSPERLQRMLESGYTPLRGTLVRGRKGRLVLNIPFRHDGEPSEENSGEPTDGVYRVASVDLGLKTLAVLSISDCTKDQDGNWQRADEDCSDTARYFIDQEQLIGKRDGWFNGSRGAGAPNLKRKLTNLQLRAWRLQSKMKRYANRHPMKYRRKKRFWYLRFQWKRAWRRMNNLHQEIAKQLATRIVAVCQHHNVDILRFEDLSWSRHSPKDEVGYFLRTWQVHWFFSQVQERAVNIAARCGISVEYGNAEYSSQRCHMCGEFGIRDRKTFTCTNPKCRINKQDADLNAARYGGVAPFPDAMCGRGGPPMVPTQVS